MYDPQHVNWREELYTSSTLLETAVGSGDSYEGEGEEGSDQADFAEYVAEGRLI